MIDAAQLLSRVGELFPTRATNAPEGQPVAPAADGRKSSASGAVTRIDRAEISPEARAAAAAAKVTPTEATDAAPEARNGEARDGSPQGVGTAAGGTAVNGKELSDSEQQEVDKLQARDREVRQHEQAHKAAAGRYGGAITYSYTTGPDGKRYASGGSVPIDTSEVAGDPQATAVKMQQVIRAANAPAEPSGADRQVAASASRKLAAARAEIVKENAAERSGESGDSNGRVADQAALAPTDEASPSAPQTPLDVLA
ncbi:MAG: putative metalloprotease CJM1_0395 family protein [Planctomycetota bacterium]